MSDALSRDSWHETVASMSASGVATHSMRPAGECNELIEHASTLPQRTSPPVVTQPAHHVRRRREAATGAATRRDDK